MKYLRPANALRPNPEMLAILAEALEETAPNSDLEPCSPLPAINHPLTSSKFRRHRISSTFAGGLKTLDDLGGKKCS